MTSKNYDNSDYELMESDCCGVAAIDGTDICGSCNEHAGFKTKYSETLNRYADMINQLVYTVK
tara:strand:- start:1165 stop:1353 length:189 start_codon:yes stop_codon:yes gene_type:complete